MVIIGILIGTGSMFYQWHKRRRFRGQPLWYFLLRECCIRCIRWPWKNLLWEWIRLKKSIWGSCPLKGLFQLIMSMPHNWRPWYKDYFWNCSYYQQHSQKGEWPNWANSQACICISQFSLRWRQLLCWDRWGKDDKFYKLKRTCW